MLQKNHYFSAGNVYSTVGCIAIRQKLNKYCGMPARWRKHENIFFCCHKTLNIAPTVDRSQPFGQGKINKNNSTNQKTKCGHIPRDRTISLNQDGCRRRASNTLKMMSLKSQNTLVSSNFCKANSQQVQQHIWFQTSYFEPCRRSCIPFFEVEVSYYGPSEYTS